MAEKLPSLRHIEFIDAVMRQVLLAPKTPWWTLHLAFTLARLANERTHLVWLDKREVASVIHGGISLRSLRKCTAALIEVGVLVPTDQPGRYRVRAKRRFWRNLSDVDRNGVEMWQAERNRQKIERSGAP